MGKALVLYHSQDGNTEKMARLVAEGAAQIPKIEGHRGGQFAKGKAGLYERGAIDLLFVCCRPVHSCCHIHSLKTLHFKGFNYD